MTDELSEAHKQENQMLKLTKAAAQAEIDLFCLQREEEFKAKEATALVSHGSCSTEVERETQRRDFTSDLLSTE
ncbi:V-type proton ATPase subunit G 1 [Plecturocebus cupreus]